MRRTAAALFAALFAASSVAFAADVPPPQSRREGLILHTFDVGRLRQLQLLVGGQTPNVARDIDVIDLRTEADFGLKDDFLAEIIGWLQIDKEGDYAFQLNSDDGSEFLLDGHTVINYDGLHSAKEPSFGTVHLKAGPHELLARMFDATVDQQITLKWKPPGATEFEVVPKQAFFSEANVVHVTSPGKKNVIAPLSNTRPGDGEPLVDVHPSFKLSNIGGDDFQPKIGGIDFLPDGRMVVCTWDPHGEAVIIDTKTGERKKFASGLAEPLGLKVVDGEIYVLQKQELTQVIDNDHDGVADEYRCVSQAWPVTGNFHEFAFGLVYQDGWFYANLAVAINPGGHTTKPQLTQDPQTGLGRGQTIRIKRATGKVEVVAQGLRAPNGIALMPSTGDIWITDNQGDWLPSSKLMKLIPGSFYGEHTVPEQSWADRGLTPPVVWLPQNEIGNSPSQPAECLVGPWKGQILNGDVTHGGVKRTFVETVEAADGTFVMQGCVFRFIQGLQAGVNRLCWGPDGALYVGEIGNSGDWAQEGKKWFGLQRLEYHDAVGSAEAFEILAVRAKSNGFELELTQPLADGMGGEPTHYFVEQWRYEPTDDYGGPKLDNETLAVKSATVSSDRKHVFLELAGLKPGHVVYFRLADLLHDASGKKLWSTEGWYTLNAIPANMPGEVGPANPHNTLTDAEINDGWQLLFDGKTIDHWHGYQKQTVPDGWQAVDGELRRIGPGGDLVSNEEYGDFEFSYEWKISPGGNSGVYYRVDESQSPGWTTGVEMQVLDNARHADGRNALTSAGSVYALVPPKRDTSLGADRWNVARIVARGTKVEHWLNNELVASYDTSTEEWKQLIAKSKFKDMANFAKSLRGRICLQDHGDEVAFRNLKIRELK